MKDSIVVEFPLCQPKVEKSSTPDSDEVYRLPSCSEELGTAIQNLIQLMREPASLQKKTG